MSARRLTPAGPGAVAVLAVRGADALARVAALVDGRAPAPRDAGRVRLVRLAREGEDLDEALVYVRSADEVELHLHGSPPLVEEVMRLLGAERAQPGPRALEERARALLAGAPCEAAARVALDQSEGALRRDLLALVPMDAATCADSLAALCERGRQARHLFEPARIVLGGPVNAGKSTLFNVLVGEGRVVVSDTAGTTRDLVEEPARLGEWPVLLVDTAGLREVEGEAAPEEIERAGQDLARVASAEADLVLWLVPVGADSVSPSSGAEILLTQADRRARVPWPEGALSALDEPEGARGVVESVFRRRFDLPALAWQPGAGVPFEPGLLAALRELSKTLPAAAPAARENALADLLH